MTMQTEISPGAAVAVVPAEDGWQWVLKATCVVALAVAALQVVWGLVVIWGITFSELHVFASWPFGSNSTNLIMFGWIVISLATLVCLFLAGIAGLKRWAHARRLMLLAALLRAVGTVSIAVYSYLQMRLFFANKGWAEALYYQVQQVLHVASELWLPVLLVVVATRPAIKLLLDEPRAGGAFEPLPLVTAAQPESPTPS